MSASPFEVLSCSGGDSADRGGHPRDGRRGPPAARGGV